MNLKGIDAFVKILSQSKEEGRKISILRSASASISHLKNKVTWSGSPLMMRCLSARLEEPEAPIKIRVFLRKGFISVTSSYKASSALSCSVLVFERKNPFFFLRDVRVPQSPILAV